MGPWNCSTPNGTVISGLLLSEQTSQQVLRQGKLEGLTDGPCLFGGETARSGDAKKSRDTDIQREKKIGLDPHRAACIFVMGYLNKTQRKYTRSSEARGYPGTKIIHTLGYFYNFIRTTEQDLIISVSAGKFGANKPVVLC